MTDEKHQHDTVHWHVNEVTSRIVAETGIPSDRFHIGKILVQCMKDTPDMISQIDGATGQSEINSSVLRRSIQCAISLRKIGIQQGDVAIIMGPNHLDLCVPLYATLFEGIIAAPVDMTFGVSALKDAFLLSKPKVVICQSEKVIDVQSALAAENLEAKVISFNPGHDLILSEFLKMADDKEIEEYRCADFDPETAIAFLVPTSGTTGQPKLVVTTHKSFIIKIPYISSRATQIPYINISLIASPLQWLSTILNFLGGPLVLFTKLQSSQPMTLPHLFDLINKYKPDFLGITPTAMATLVKFKDQCDFTCFKIILLGGAAAHPQLIKDIKEVSPETDVTSLYGLSELNGSAFGHGFSSPPHSLGKPITCHFYRLVDIETGKDVKEPFKEGELWLKGPGIFKEYYNDPEATKEAFSEDGWFKTGDLMYRDEAWNFHFVERIKLLLKYMCNKVSPIEVEAVIRKNPGVMDVVVTAVEDCELGELPVACIVTRPGHTVTAQEIKDLVKESLPDFKHLHGGVVFMDKFPVTSTTKVDRRKIKEMVVSMKRE